MLRNRCLFCWAGFLVLDSSRLGDDGLLMGDGDLQTQL